MTVLRRLALLGLFLPAPALAQDPLTQADPFESRFRQGSNFEIQFKPPEKGGEVRLYTKNPVRFEKDRFWEGSVEVLIEYQDVKIRADAARYDFPTRTAVLTGNVVIDQGPTRLTGVRGTFYFETKTGLLEEAQADLPPTFHIVARTIEKIGEATYRIDHGLFTACSLPNPAWSFSVSEATVTLDDYARMRDVAFRAGPVPMLYTPYLVWPTKEDRASGMLVPGIGYSQSRGGFLGLSYYWVTGRPTDLTTALEVYTDGSIGLGQEARWRPTPESGGIFQGFVIRDQNATVCVPLDQAPPVNEGPCTLPDGSLGVFTQQPEWRWKLLLDHVADDLPYGFRGVLSIRQYSDEEFLQDFERSFTISSAKQILSRGFLTRNFGADSVNLRLERSETFYAATVIQERIPSLEYFHRTSPLGKTPLYLAAEASVSGLYVNKGRNLPRGTYGRLDLYPVLSFPWKEIPWLSVTARAGGRITQYTDSINQTQTAFTGEPLTRTYGEAGLSFVGPSFSRIFDTGLGPYDKWKHVIEPRVEYEWVSDVSDPARIPAYDQIDTALGRNQVRYALVNRLLGRRGAGPGGSAEEFASLEFSQTYAFEPPQTIYGDSVIGATTRRLGPLNAVLRVAPTGLFQLDGRVVYDTDASKLTAASVTGGFGWKSNFVHVSWFAGRPVLTGPGSPSADSDQIRFAAGMDLLKSFRLDAGINYDARQDLFQEIRTLVTYKGSCYTVFLEFRELRLPPIPRRDVRLVVNLKDIGTLLDVNGSLDRLFQ